MPKHTNGPWKAHPYANPTDSRWPDYGFAAFVTGGNNSRLIAEFVTPEDANLAAASLKMLEALQNLENDDAQRMPKSAWTLVQDAIKAAGGRPK